MLSEAIKEIQDWQKENKWGQKPLPEITKSELETLDVMYKELICKLLTENIDSWEYSYDNCIKLNIKNYIIIAYSSQFTIVQRTSERSSVIFKCSIHFWSKESKIAKYAIKRINKLYYLKASQGKNEILERNFDKLRGA